MKLFGVVVLAAAALAQQQQTEGKRFVRQLPANELRDQPGYCFAWTSCDFFLPGDGWSLAPFCGKSTCGKSGNTLVEVVEDCGPLPKNNPDCSVVNVADQHKEFPVCCPRFECINGATLEFPTAEELAAAAAAQPTAAQAAAVNTESKTASKTTSTT